MKKAASTKPAMPTSRFPPGLVRLRQSARKPPSTVPTRPPRTRTAPETRAAEPTDSAKRRPTKVGSQKAADASTKKSTVWARIVARRVGMLSRRRKLPRLESRACSTRGPRPSALPRSGSRRRKASAAKTIPGSAVKKKALRHPKCSATKPPPANPTAMPIALPAPQIDIARPRASFRK